ncbi:hypothetical protein KI387_020908, partial [Taxus chinensis]
NTYAETSTVNDGMLWDGPSSPPRHSLIVDGTPKTVGAGGLMIESYSDFMEHTSKEFLKSVSDTRLTIDEQKKTFFECVQRFRRDLEASNMLDVAFKGDVNEISTTRMHPWFSASKKIHHSVSKRLVIVEDLNNHAEDYECFQFPNGNRAKRRQTTQMEHT